MMIQSSAVIGYKSQAWKVRPDSRGTSLSPRRGAIRITQAGLLIAAIGALFVVFRVIPMVGLVMTVVGAVLAARMGIGHGWYTVVAAGAALEVIARLLAESSETLGGWLAVIASVIILWLWRSGIRPPTARA